MAFNPADSSFTYTPNSNFVGEDSFKYIICDVKGACDTATVTVNIIPIIPNNDPPVAIDDANTTPINTPVSGTVAKNDSDPDGNTPLVFSKISNPTNGTIVFNPDGSYTYTPNPNFTGNDQVVYKVCDAGTPIACDTATLYLTVLPIAPVPPVDIAVSKTIVGSSDCKRQVGDLVTFRVKVFRQDLQNILVSGIIVKDSLSPFFEFVSATSTKGTFDANTGLWNNIALVVGDTAILDVKVKIKLTFMGGLICNEAWLSAMNGTDLDSKAGNKIESEDDFARVCVSVPIKICNEREEKVLLTAPSGYINYQWYLNGQPIIGANSPTYLVSTFGMYTIRVDNSQCPSGGCCPIYVENFCECKPIICVPFIIQKTKKAK